MHAINQSVYTDLLERICNSTLTFHISSQTCVYARISILFFCLLLFFLLFLLVIYFFFVVLFRALIWYHMFSANKLHACLYTRITVQKCIDLRGPYVRCVCMFSYMYVSVCEPTTSTDLTQSNLSVCFFSSFSIYINISNVRPRDYEWRVCVCVCVLRDCMYNFGAHFFPYMRLLILCVFWESEWPWHSRKIV